MVTIGMNYFVLPGKEQIFEDACDRVVKTMQGIDGHDVSHLYRRVGDDERAYLIVSRWQSVHGMGKVTVWGQALEWHHMGTGTLRRGFSKQRGAWTDRFSGTKKK